MKEVPEMTFLKCNQVLAVSAIVLAASGCNIGPDLSGTSAPDISGSWTFEASFHNVISRINQPDDDIFCDAKYRLVIDQNDNTFTGTYSGGGLICVLRGDTILNRPASGTIVNGTVGDDGWLCIKECGIEVSFGFDTMNARQTGLLSGSLGNRTSMSGTANWRAYLGVADVGTSPLRGPWTAVR